MLGGMFVLALAACPSSEALTLQARAATAGDVDVEARIVDDTVHVVVVARGDTTVERTLDVTTADCDTLPDLVVVVAQTPPSSLPPAPSSLPAPSSPPAPAAADQKPRALAQPRTSPAVARVGVGGALVVVGYGNVQDATAATMLARFGAGVAVDVGDVEVGLGAEVGPHVELRAGTAATSLAGTRVVATAAWTFSADTLCCCS